MKASVILALPALAVAAATPQEEKRQLPTSLLDPTCLLEITGITRCLPNLNLNSIVRLRDVLRCPLGILDDILDDVLECLDVDITVPGTK
ncbi:hypothetical protein FGADI_150 [Fusarium gaditjirri]|uniref:Hydrophobin n=1 Tax=Fusarium gaditjirri TaxID=282569 RepID=A0A8H4TP59_9HYPO|nr:hypothetical protein FGADI_150 [Fusarium gaditjirri]